MAKRLSNELVNVEYKSTDNYIRLSDLLVELEYKLTNNFIQCSNLAIMVEYQQNAAPALKYGPKIQCVG